MLFRTKLLASAALFTFTASFAYGNAHTDMTAETVVASVNGSDITLGQLVMLRSQLPEQYQQLADDVVFNGLIEQLVNQQLLGDTLEVEPKRVGIAIANEVRSLRAGEVVNTFTGAPVDEADLQAAYDARFADIVPEAEYNASHILVETEEEAIEIRTMIDDGADFAETAVEKSTGPSGPSGGELGWFGLGDNSRDGRLDHAHFDVLGQFDLKLAVVFDLNNLADQPALGHDLITTAQTRNHRLMFFYLLLLRADQQEIHDREDQNERDELLNTLHGVDPLSEGARPFRPAVEVWRNLGPDAGLCKES